MSTPIEAEVQDLLAGHFRGPSVCDAWSSLCTAPGISDEFRLRFRFEELVRGWKRDTEHISVLSKTVMHPDYQKIIGMGKLALPFIFDELQRRGGHWFWALHAITQEDPARDCVGFQEAAHAWLEWGRSHGYL
jgi:hypothetical protein